MKGHDSVLVTGGAGFIGWACAVEFLSRGCQVVIIDCFEDTLYERRRKERNLERLGQLGSYRLEGVDLRDADAVWDVFQGTGFDLVAHFPPVAGVRPSIEKASYYWDVNAVGTATLVEIAREAGVENFALASSSTVYRGNDKTPFAETDRVDEPISPYVTSKRGMELYAQKFQHLHGGNIAYLRFCTVYGPRQRPEMGIHNFMRILDEGGTIPMYGDGTSGRDYTYIADIVGGIMAAMGRLEGFRIYNRGGDEVIRLRDLFDAIADIVEVEPDIDQQPIPRPTSRSRTPLSPARAANSTTTRRRTSGRGSKRCGSGIDRSRPSTNDRLRTPRVESFHVSELRAH